MTSKVLILDDSLTVQMDLRDAFREAGLETVIHSTVAGARREIEGGGVDLAILDVQLPDGDGVELLREIRSRPAALHLPVLMLSTEADVGDRIRGLRTGADDYVGKPYDRSYVVARAQQLLSRPQPAGATPLVLVIDESGSYREELRRALEKAGYRVATASTGEEGLRTAIARRPAVIIVDGVLPGIDGAGVLRRIRQDAVLRRTPCLMLTALDDVPGELHALDAGADAFVRKQPELDLLLVRLAALLRGSPAPATSDAGTSFLGPKRILAVGGEPESLERLAADLLAEGYDVVTARSGEEALELVGVQPPQAILLDFALPGMSGEDTCRRVKGTPGWRDVPLIVLGDQSDERATIAAINAGADDFIPKTSELAVLKARLRAQLRRQQYETETREIRDEALRQEIQAAEARAARELAELRSSMLHELEQKNRDLESFSYSVSHDLRAPLRAIDGFCRILEEDHGPSLAPDAQRCLGVIRDNARRMAQLIDDLLDFSRLGRQSLESVTLDIDELARMIVREQTQPAAQDRRIEWKIASLPPAYADRALTRQLLTNLVSNALKYTRPRDPALIEVGARRAGAMNEYFVRDNGVGFDPQYVHKLFGVFQRLHTDREFEGTGVGLAIVQRIAERHGGTVTAAGELDRGATFTFTLPAAVEPS
jgi:two-component system, NtrC family, sensor kinase